MSTLHALTRWALVAAFSLVTASAQNVLQVPGAFATIQSAIDAASPGDTVEVASGTYFERIDFSGKDIAVVGQGPNLSVINGASPNFGSTVTFSGGETAAARLSGFRITGGRGTLLTGGVQKLIGGAIVCFSASPTIENCTLSGNNLPAISGPLVMVGGGGMAVSGPGALPLIRRCVIENNMVHVPMTGLVTLQVMGGGVLFENGAIGRMEECVIRNNEVTTAPGLGDGGGIGSSGPLGLFRCTISGNRAGDGGGVVALGSTRIESCRIIQNQATTGCGGGLALGDAGQATHEVAGCVVAGNTAAVTGGGMMAVNVTLDHVTVADNTAASDGGLHLPTGFAFIERSIVWGNSPDVFCNADALVIDSCVAGATESGCVGKGSSNVVDIDPMFVSPPAGNFAINPASPLRDTVQSSSPTLTEDIDGDPRLFCPLSDMGADEFYGFDDIAAGTVGAGAGGPFDVLLINGENGGIDRRVVLEQEDSFTLEVLQPPGQNQAADFIIFGFIGIPDPGMVQVLPMGVGSTAIPVEILTPGVPGAFTLTASQGGIPSQLVTSTPAPWSLTSPGAPFELKISFQGVITDGAGGLDVTNGIIVEYRE